MPLMLLLEVFNTLKKLRFPTSVESGPASFEELRSKAISLECR